MEWFIKSNALVKSRKTVPTKLLFIALIQVSTIAVRAVSQEWFDLNPDCVL